MLKTLKRKIDTLEGMLALCRRKANDNNKKLSAYWYWLGVSSGIESCLKDLKELQQIAEADVSSIDHCLDALRGL